MRGRVVLICLLVLALGTVPLTAGSTSQVSAVSKAQAQTNTTTPPAPAPGAQLAGAFAVEETTLETEYRQEVLATELDQARSDEQASIVVATVIELRNQVGTLERELQQLQTAHRSEEISDARYTAELAAITTDAAGIEETLGQIRPVAAQPPNSAPPATGTIIAIDQLSERATALSGGEILRQSEQGTPESSPTDGDDSDETTGNTTESTTTDNDDDDDDDSNTGDDDDDSSSDDGTDDDSDEQDTDDDGDDNSD